jgi:hypothetical protein
MQASFWEIEAHVGCLCEIKICPVSLLSCDGLRLPEMTMTLLPSPHTLLQSNLTTASMEDVHVQSGQAEDCLSRSNKGEGTQCECWDRKVMQLFLLAGEPAPEALSYPVRSLWDPTPERLPQSAPMDSPAELHLTHVSEPARVSTPATAPDDFKPSPHQTAATWDHLSKNSLAKLFPNSWSTKSRENKNGSVKLEVMGKLVLKQW